MLAGSMTPSMARSFLRVLLGRFASRWRSSVRSSVGGLVGVNSSSTRRSTTSSASRSRSTRTPIPAEPANFLLIGSDTRAFSGDPRGARRPSATRRPRVASAPTRSWSSTSTPSSRRASWSRSPATCRSTSPASGEQKINAAFNDGPAEGHRDVQQNFDIPIHHYLEVDFRASGRSSTRSGGVAVYFDAAGARQEEPASTTIRVRLRSRAATCSTAATRSATCGRATTRSSSTAEWETDQTRRPRTHRASADSSCAGSRPRRSRGPLEQPADGDSTSPTRAIAELKADEGLGRADINKLIHGVPQGRPERPQQHRDGHVPDHRRAR